MNRERKLTRARWTEAIFGGIAGVATVGLILRPSLLPIFLVVFTLVTLGLMGWQYRLMDEFRRARYLRAWAAAGVGGLTAQTGVILWAVFAWMQEAPAPSPTLHGTLSLWTLYVPWTVMLVMFFGVTAYLYRRDVGSVKDGANGAEA